MALSISRRLYGASLWAAWAAALLVFAISSGLVRAEAPLVPVAAPRSEHVDARWGGALERSFTYHRQIEDAAQTPSAEPRYRYGFPVSSYRWGWCGASRYYPTVVWHRGFNGDHKRWASRRGY